jgi:hypothetical protein
MQPSSLLIIAALCLLQSAVRAETKPATLPVAEKLAVIAQQQLRATQPDFVVFQPDLVDTRVAQTGNEHFLVFDGPDGSLMTIWTQSTGEGKPDQHIVFSRSDDEGQTWTKPRVIAGPARAGQDNIASWAFPLVSKRGRMYVLYSQHVGKFDTFFHTTGRLDGIFSDDSGRSWSAPQTVRLARTSRDNPDESFPPNIICWQKPQRLAAGDRYFAGVSRWTSKAVMKNPGKSWTSHDSVVEFMRFENIDENPDVRDIDIRWFAFDREALTVPHPTYLQVSVCQEPSIVKLPDGKLFCVMRTMQGSPFWSSSADLGETWTKPQRLLLRDGGAPILHPLSPCPIYDVGGSGAASGRYFILVHNNDGHYKGSSPEQSNLNREPLFIASGHFEKGGQQPVWFDEPKLFMQHDGTSLGAPGTPGRHDLAMYASYTMRKNVGVLWYPDRKFFLLGRKMIVDGKPAFE